MTTSTPVNHALILEKRQNLKKPRMLLPVERMEEDRVSSGMNGKSGRRNTKKTESACLVSCSEDEVMCYCRFASSLLEALKGDEKEAVISFFQKIGISGRQLRWLLKSPKKFKDVFEQKLFGR